VRTPTRQTHRPAEPERAPEAVAVERRVPGQDEAIRAAEERGHRLHAVVARNHPATLLGAGDPGRAGAYALRTVRRTWLIPCYQEEDALDAGAEALLALPGDEILFVDDGSTDGTSARLAALARRNARVRVATHPENRGVGAAMRTGFAAATGDVVVAYDVDRTYPAADAERLVAEVVNGADVATASPFAAGGAVEATPWRRFLSRGASRAYRLVLGRRAHGVSTFTAGFRAYRAERVRRLSFRSDGFPATAEILGLLLLGRRAARRCGSFVPPSATSACSSASSRGGCSGAGPPG
jgi:dolichol-phosphate mannosyltransferase